LIISIKVVAKLNLLQRVSLGSRQYKEAGYTAPKPGLARYVGSTGTVITPLRPSGTVEVDGERLDVVTEGGFIPRDAKVEVINVEGSRIIVKWIKES